LKHVFIAGDHRYYSLMLPNRLLPGATTPHIIQRFMHPHRPAKQFTLHWLGEKNHGLKYQGFVFGWGGSAF
jgi:hypothetical protein